MILWRIKHVLLLVVVWHVLGLLSAFIVGAMIGGRGAVAAYDLFIYLYLIAAIIHIGVAQIFLKKIPMIAELALVSIIGSGAVGIGGIFQNNTISAILFITFISAILIFFTTFPAAKISRKYLSVMPME